MALSSKSLFFEIHFVSCEKEFQLIFSVHGTVLRNSMSINVQQDATIHSLFYLQTALYVSGGFSTHHQENK